jgi:ADYC domain-containing protein
MKTWMNGNRCLKRVASAVLGLAGVAWAGEPARPSTPPPASAPRAERRVRPCQPQASERITWPQGTLLWGTGREDSRQETSSVLASLELGSLKLAGAEAAPVRLEGGRLLAAGLQPQALVGAVLKGTSSAGRPVEVAICEAEPSAEDETLVRYRIDIWDERSTSWVNPCIATGQTSQPRVFAVPGVWDASGARRDVRGRFTFACEGGVIAKCINWGYKPWGLKDGKPLTQLHQACTRMARADYCGNGQSHTAENTVIDMYDSLGLLERTTQASAGWVPEQASFESSWTPEGAQCMSHTRHGEEVESILAECPGRFEPVAEDLGQGDQCAYRRKGSRSQEALLRNRAYRQRDY